MITDDFEIDKGILELQGKLSLPNNFFKKLLEEDDWSFIIKLHALIEAACTDLLMFHFDEPGLKNIISRIELGNKSVGKLSFIKELDLLGENYRKYIFSLSEWRNKFVHNVQNCNALLTDAVNLMEKGALKKFAIDFSPYETTLQKFNNSKLGNLIDGSTNKQIDINNLIERAKSNPKFHIWLGAYNLLITIVDMQGYSNYLKRRKAVILLKDDSDD